MKTSNSRRYRRHRNPENTDAKEGPFFTPAHNAVQTKTDAFFQPKLAVGQPGDKYEREADAVADKVVNQPSAKGNGVQRKEISAVQAMPEKKEDEKKVQKRRDKEEEVPVQKKDAPPGDKEEKKPEQLPSKKEEEKPVQKKDDRAAPEKQEEEKKPVQKKEEPEKKPAADEVIKEEKDDKEKGGKPSVMTKKNVSQATEEGSDQLAQQLREQQGNGSPMSPAMKKEMGTAIGADFSNVRIHTGEKAAELNRELGAQAFTHGNDVYFNNGRYDTDSAAGKHLLAHELTHVVQQGAAPAAEGKQTSPAAGHTAPGIQREISTPLPEGVKPDEKSEIAEFPVGSFKVQVKPDRKATEEDNIAPNKAETKGDISTYINFTTNGKGEITKVSISKTLIIETVYGADVTSKSDSGYGRGHIKSDKDKGNKSLGFHEGNHGIDFMNYIKSHKFPEIVIKKPVSQAEFDALKAKWDVKFDAYVKDMMAKSKKDTDDVTDPPAAVPAPAPAPAAPSK
ncbi:eCIS core domain-containing protein [Chitinophaga agri]|uniref:DUF4157 domain-containing protein n=1 Tax=Chitinophaga agri TaxID=2703787 RepID=A0A6B9ZP64_9BACT|nr:DUF4157 domain-containing protein [Chitinophaga agri]QHS63699.1 DUF4157 domain-containing protein [Chitinophaga agri]